MLGVPMPLTLRPGVRLTASPLTLCGEPISSFFFFKNFYTIFKGYSPFTGITKYRLYSSCCTIYP